MRTIHRNIVSAVIFSKDGKLLMGMKDPNSGGVYADCWHIPGGGVDEDETHEQALRREILEEVGIDTASCRVTLADDQGNGETEKTLKDTGETVLCKMNFYVYRVDVDKHAAEIELEPNDDLVKLEWVSLSDLNKYKLTPPSASLFTRLGYYERMKSASTNSSSHKTKPVVKEDVELLKKVAGQAENTTGFVFHGSHQPHAKLEPQPVYWKDPKGKLYPDSEGAVVCASDKPYIPVFMALLPRKSDWGYVSNGRGQGLTYYIEEAYKAEFLQASGYVLVLDGRSFQKVIPPIPAGWKYDMPIGGRQAEMRSKDSVAVKYAIKVTFADFEMLLRLEGNSKIEYR